MDAQWLWGMSSSHSARWKAASLGYHLVTQWHHSLFMHTGRISPPDVLGVPHPQLWWLSAFAHTDFLLRTNHPFTFSLGDPVQTMPVCPSLLCRLLSPHSWTHLQLLHQADHVAISTEARCSAFCLLPSAFHSGSKERSYILFYLWFPKSGSEPGILCRWMDFIWCFYYVANSKDFAAEGFVPNW